MAADLRRYPIRGSSRAVGVGARRRRKQAARGAVSSASRRRERIPAPVRPTDTKADTDVSADAGAGAGERVGVVPDPVSRFPFRVADPDAELVRRPGGWFGLDGIEPDIADVPPGPELAALLTSFDPAEVSDDGLVELVAAAVRQEAWTHATATRFAGMLGQRACMNPAWAGIGGQPAAPCVAGDELAMRLSWSTRAANRLVQHGLAFERALGPTGDALARGDLDVIKAQIIADRLDGLWCETALDVQDTILDRATRRTPTQLRTDLERELIRVDPDEAAARRKHARTGRRVDRPKVLPDEMAGLWAVLPAATAMRIHATLDAAARTARTAGDPRTLDQLRADGLTDLILHTGCTPTGPGAAFGLGTGLGTGAGLGTDPETAFHVGDDPETTFSVGTDPESGAGISTGTGPEARSRMNTDSGAGTGTGTSHAIPGGATFTTDTGTDGTDGTGTGGPSGVVSALLAEDTTTSPDTNTPEPPTLGFASQDTPAPSQADGTSHCPTVRRAPATHILVTVDLATLIGLDDQPAHLTGYGPINAVTARALAEGGIWRRLVTDPLTGTILDLGRTRYRPTTGIVEHIQTRDRTCARPGCTTPATSCDLDHTIEYHPPPGVAPDPAVPLGTTSTDNLGPLCRRDHRLKTEAGFTLRQPSPGEFEWTTPTGHRYRVIPGDDGWNEHLGTTTPEPPEPEPDPTPDLPPF